MKDIILTTNFLEKQQKSVIREFQGVASGAITVLKLYCTNLKVPTYSSNSLNYKLNIPHIRGVFRPKFHT
jgi:hypothetical protein